MAELVVSIVVFTAFHALPSTPLRARLIDLLGREVFLWAFSIASVLLFAWVWIAYRTTVPDTLLWATGPFVRWLSALAMLPALALIALAFAQRPRVLLTAETALARPDATTGVVRITRHPLLWGVGLWGIVHLVNNGDAPSLVFFGYVTALALGGTWPIDRRRARLLGERWPEIERRTSNLPFLAIAQRRNRFEAGELSLPALGAAAALWLMLLLLHHWLFGVPIVAP